MSTQWGYKQGKAMEREMCGGYSKGGRVGVKAHSRAPRAAKPRMPMPQPPMPDAPTPDMSQMPAPMPQMGMRKGGGVKCMARGGAVKSDAKQDRATVKSMVKPSCMKAKGGKVSAKAPMKASPPSKDIPEARGMAKGGKWISGAIKHPGALHKQLGVPQGQKIPAKKLAAAATKGGTLGRRARLAQTLKKMHHG